MTRTFNSKASMTSIQGANILILFQLSHFSFRKNMTFKNHPSLYIYYTSPVYFRLLPSLPLPCPYHLPFMSLPTFPAFSVHFQHPAPHFLSTSFTSRPFGRLLTAVKLRAATPPSSHRRAAWTSTACERQSHSPGAARRHRRAPLAGCSQSPEGKAAFFLLRASAPPEGVA